MPASPRGSREALLCLCPQRSSQASRPRGRGCGELGSRAELGSGHQPSSWARPWAPWVGASDQEEARGTARSFVYLHF